MPQMHLRQSSKQLRPTTSWHRHKSGSLCAGLTSWWACHCWASRHTWQRSYCRRCCSRRPHPLLCIQLLLFGIANAALGCALVSGVQHLGLASNIWDTNQECARVRVRLQQPSTEAAAGSLALTAHLGVPRAQQSWPRARCRSSCSQIPAAQARGEWPNVRLSTWIPDRGCAGSTGRPHPRWPAHPLARTHSV